MNKRLKERLKNSWARTIGFYCLDVYNYFKYRFLKRDLVLVYQMGKVASSSIYYSLKESDNIVYHVHRLSEKHIRELHKTQLEKTGLVESKAVDERGVRLNNMFIKSNKRPIHIISLVRNPIDRNMSAFFQNKEYYTKKHDYSDTEKLTNLFYQLYDHDTPLNWFDREFKDCLNVDIYDSSFPKDKKYKLLKSNNYNILLMRVDLEDSIKENIISAFLGISNFKLKNKNVGIQKTYNEEYKDFKRKINLSDSYMNKMLNSKFTNYFYTNSEISEIRSKWLEKR